MNGNQHDFTLFRFSIGWLEKYIEKSNFFSDWEQRKQINPSHIKWNPSAREALESLGTNLFIEFGNNGKGKDRKTAVFRKAVKNEFYKWINVTKIDNSCPQELKIVLVSFHEILSDKQAGYKLLKSAENARKEMDLNSPEYQKKMEEFFPLVGEVHASGKAFETDEREFKGDMEAGKETFQQIDNSVSVSEREKFNFWPQMTEEEKEKEDKKNDGQTDPILTSYRSAPIAKITQALNERKLTNTDLEPENQNWEAEINSSSHPIEITNISSRVLADVKKKTNLLLPPNQRCQKQFW